jgi:hypothetical protein
LTEERESMPTDEITKASSEPPRRSRLWAERGDRLVIHGHRIGQPERDAEILETLGENGSPPFRVRWSDSGREATLFPGSDAFIEHLPHRRKKRSP